MFAYFLKFILSAYTGCPALCGQSTVNVECQGSRFHCLTNRYIIKIKMKNHKPRSFVVTSNRKNNVNCLVIY